MKSILAFLFTIVTFSSAFAIKVCTEEDLQSAQTLYKTITQSDDGGHNYFSGINELALANSILDLQFCLDKISKDTYCTKKIKNLRIYSDTQNGFSGLNKYTEFAVFCK